MRHTFECEGGKKQMEATDAEIDSPKTSTLVSEDGMPTMTGECANQGNGTRTPRAVNGHSGSKRDNGSPGRETHHRRTRSRPTLPASKGPSPAQQSSHEEERERSVQEGVPGDISPDMLYKHLIDRFPARSSEIKQLLGFFGEPTDLMLPLFIYGGASTGKTSIILNALRMMNRPFAYASCRSSHTPRILFESILNQLTKHTRSSSNNFGSSKKCDKLSDFLGLLCDACHAAALEKAGAISKGSTCPLKKGGTEKVDVDNFPKPVIYLIFDNIDLLLDWSGGLKLISALMRLSEFTGMENLGLIFISSLGPDAFFSGTGMLEPIPIYMRDYTDDDLYQILLKKKPKGELYSSFLSAVLKPFSRVTRHVTELSEALERLFQKYIEPVRRGIVKPDEQGKRKLFSLIQPHITSALHQTSSFLISAHSSQGNVQKRPYGDYADLGFQLSLCSKYLLISAFICSRNPATLDATLFDSTGGRSKKRRRSSQTAVDKKEMDMQEKLLKGPGTFPLERLLAIFSCISADFSDDEEEAELALMDHCIGVKVSSDVLMQISTLINANLLYKGSSDPLEGAPRYRCNASEELIQMVSRSINFPLSRYLYRL